ncbi:MAG: TIGR04438 family Trp-rich protein [Burkholderiaceae bacterium]
MYLLWAGVVLIALKYFDVGPVAQWSWWWILAPLVAAFIWFEFLERLFGRDRRQAVDPGEKQHRERIANSFGEQAGRRHSR